MHRLDAIAQSNLSLPAKWLAVFFQQHENRKGEVVTTPAAIRMWTALDRSSVWDGITMLEAHGFLRVIEPFQPGPKSSGKFALTWGDGRLQQPSHSEIVDDRDHLVSGGAKTADSHARARNVSLSFLGSLSS